MFVVLSNGKKLPVDDSTVDYEKDMFFFRQSVGLYTDETILKPVWILEMNRNNRWNGQNHEVRRGNVLDFVGEMEFDHEPAQEEILWAMASFGLGRGDIAFVRKGLMLDYEGVD